MDHICDGSPWALPVYGLSAPHANRAPEFQPQICLTGERAWLMASQCWRLLCLAEEVRLEHLMGCSREAPASGPLSTLTINEVEKHICCVWYSMWTGLYTMSKPIHPSLSWVTRGALSAAFQREARTNRQLITLKSKKLAQTLKCWFWEF